MGSDIKVFLVRHGAKKKQEAAAAKYPIIEDENAKYFLPKKVRLTLLYLLQENVFLRQWVRSSGIELTIDHILS